MFSSKLLLGCCLAIISSGCGVVPSKVSYATYTPLQTAKGSTNHAPRYPFRLRRSVLLIRINDEDKLTVVASPWELGADGQYSPLYSMQGTDNFRSTTQVKMSYIDNTKFIDELTVTTKNNVADTISNVGALIKAVVPVAATLISGAAEKTIKFRPTMVDPAGTTPNVWFKDPLNSNLCIRLRAPVVESALTIEDYFMAQEAQTSFPVPACATATLDLAIVDDTDRCEPQPLASASVTTTQTTYAHHANVLPMPLPSTGSLKMHAVCGASVTEVGPQDRFQLLSNLTSIVSQAKEIHAAWKEAKEKASSTNK